MDRNVTKIPIHLLNAAPYNPRVKLRPGDAIFDNLKRSLKTFGYLQPIIVNRRNHTVVGGHQRLRVLKDLGYQEVDVVFVDLSAEHERALNLTLNKTVGESDESKLARLLQEFEGFPDIDLQLTGLDTGEIADLISRVLDRETATVSDDDFDLEAALDWSRPAVTGKGELLELGDHRLLCGDATNVEDVRRLMKGQRAALFMTDLPYLVGYDATNHPVSKAHRSASKRKNKNWSGSYGVTQDDADANPNLHDNFHRVAVAEAVAPNAARCNTARTSRTPANWAQRIEGSESNYINRKVGSLSESLDSTQLTKTVISPALSRTIR